MSPLEIFICIILLILVPAFAIKVSFNVVEVIKRGREKRKDILNQINSKVQQGLNSINGIIMSPAEIKKMMMKKSKFILKVDKIIAFISHCSSVPARTEYIRDNLAGTNCSVRLLSYEDQRLKPYLVDYTFVTNVLIELIESTKFPHKHDYMRLNELYKKYKNLEKEKKNEKL